MGLMLLHTAPDELALTHWATRQRWLSSDGDLGYALHALLAEAFKGNPPTPFRYMNTEGLLAYTTADERQLSGAIKAAPLHTKELLGLRDIRMKPFPEDWPIGKHLGFEVRVRPVIRTNAGKERDLYQYRMEQNTGHLGETSPSRETLYHQWLGERLATRDACRMIGATMHGFALKQVVRRAQMQGNVKKRVQQGITGPDALFRGELEVRDPLAFRDLLARGIGRHRAFGYGMLLLRPARA